MYITISAHRTSGNYAQSVSDFVDYLQKENEGKETLEMENFFNQYENSVEADKVVEHIDGNTAKLKKSDPKFYSITVSPSKRELDHLQKESGDLKTYTREIMKAYVKSFNRELDGRSLTINDIVYYAKIEHKRTFKGTDREIAGNQPYATEILKLRQEIRRIERGDVNGNIVKLNKRIAQLEKDAPFQQEGKRIVQGMEKAGLQTHVHIIVSRKDASNNYSLSPGSKHRASEVVMHGKTVKRGFDRDAFFKESERIFDKTFSYQRNFVEAYQSRKLLVQNPKIYFKSLIDLPTSQKAIAFKILRESEVSMPPVMPTSKVQVALKTIKALKRGIGFAIDSGSIGV